MRSRSFERRKKMTLNEAVLAALILALKVDGKKGEVV